jgi:hypothetical protein
MLSSPNDRVTRPLTSSNERFTDVSMPAVPSQERLPRRQCTSAKLPIVIPATEKRPQKTSPQRRPVVLVGVVVSTVVIALFTLLFVVPLDTGQHSHSIAQTVGDWFSIGPLGAVNPSQHLAPPTPTPALITNGEGYCGGSDIWGTCATAITASGMMGTGQLQRPILGAVITQVFGNSEYQQWCGCWKPHTGIDLAASYGTPIMAADSGQVIWAGWEWSGLGWAVKINHGHYIATIYGHLDHFIVKVGENVTRGQVIGYEGSSGASTGPHLHFMVLNNNIWGDPTKYIALP